MRRTCPTRSARSTASMTTARSPPTIPSSTPPAPLPRSGPINRTTERLRLGSGVTGLLWETEHGAGRPATRSTSSRRARTTGLGRRQHGHPARHHPAQRAGHGAADRLLHPNPPRRAASPSMPATATRAGRTICSSPVSQDSSCAGLRSRAAKSWRRRRCSSSSAGSAMWRSGRTGCSTSCSTRGHPIHPWRTPDHVGAP